MECKICGKNICKEKFIFHIDSHELTEKEKCIIYEQAINEGHHKKIYKYEKLYLDVLFELNKEFTFKQFNADVKYIRSFNAYIKTLESFKDIDITDIFNFFNCYIPYRKVHPKENNGLECAMAYCGNDEKMGKEFYDKIMLQKNPFYKHDGSLSPFSKTFNGYKNLTEDEKKKKIRQRCFCKDRSDFDKLKKNSSTSIEFYLNKGYTLDEAKKMRSERQRTFSLQKCIEKYGETAGRQRFDERQKKWLNSLNTPENIEKIKNGQDLGRKNSNKKGYSDISQRMFFSILQKLDIKKEDVYFALNNDEFTINNFANSIFRLDFYIPSLKKWIEFDGEYWHGKKRGNQLRDKRREDRIKELVPGIQLKRINESDYRKDPEKIVNECVEWIKQ